jgi:hypothetical protein
MRYLVYIRHIWVDPVAQLVRTLQPEGLYIHRTKSVSLISFSKNTKAIKCVFTPLTRSYYRKENAASPPRAGTMRNLLNKGQFMRSRFARTRYEEG